MLLRSKTIEVRKKEITCFTKQMGLTHCALTQTTQKSLRDRRRVQAILHNDEERDHKKDLCDIINMEIPIPYSYHSSKMLETKEQMQSMLMHQQLSPSK
jgi:hypothetical protein